MKSQYTWMSKVDNDVVDLFVIGGGINGCGIARDAAGRGLSVTLCEKNDIASGTSSASTKLFHGGLRYLEYLEVRLVREALIERETLLKAMPHISWPMRFVLPYHREQRFESSTPVGRFLGFTMPWMKGRRPAWLIRLGLFLYDHLGGRKILPATDSIDLSTDPVGSALQEKYTKAFEYSDCWIEDSRLVVLNARDAELRGAEILTRTEVKAAEVKDGIWEIRLQSGESRKARAIVNAAGPWVGEVIGSTIRLNSTDKVRLVRGSHIVTKKLFDHDKCYFFQGRDGRIIFAIPYETDFTLIGTTDADHPNPSTMPECTDEEQEYLTGFASEYFQTPVTRDDIVWTYSGVRPLYDDGASSASAATRDYVLKLDDSLGAPLLNIFGGKITTYRRLAEHALDKMGSHLTVGTAWTAGVALPGGDFPVDAVNTLVKRLEKEFPFLTAAWAKRMIRAYGSEAREVLEGATTKEDLGEDFGATLTAREVEWLIVKEYVYTAEDVVWRRSKLGLKMTPDNIAALDVWIAKRRTQAPV